MVDLGSAKVNKVIIHRVGNKLRDEGVYVSSQECPRTTAVDELLLGSFLEPVLVKGQQYDLVHESDISLNTVHHYASLIFADVRAFASASEAIAQHLYSCSTHPNIGGGEFLVILFDEVMRDGVTSQALGLFRVEDKKNFLDVAEEQGAITVLERLGIALDRVQKGAVILADNCRVFVVDSLGQKTKYWMDSFLKAAPSRTSKVCAKATGELVKAISGQVESPDAALSFGRQLDERLSAEDAMTISNLRELARDYVDQDNFDELVEETQQKYGIPLENDLRVQSRQLSRYAKDVVTKSRLADGVNLFVSNSDVRIKHIDIVPTDNGFQALIDFDITGEGQGS